MRSILSQSTEKKKNPEDILAAVVGVTYSMVMMFFRFMASLITSNQRNEKSVNSRVSFDYLITENYIYKSAEKDFKAVVENLYDNIFEKSASESEQLPLIIKFQRICDHFESIKTEDDIENNFGYIIELLNHYAQLILDYKKNLKSPQVNTSAQTDLGIKQQQSIANEQSFFKKTEPNNAKSPCQTNSIKKGSGTV
jgi:hypothetical protein